MAVSSHLTFAATRTLDNSASTFWTLLNCRGWKYDKQLHDCINTLTIKEKYSESSLKPVFNTDIILICHMRKLLYPTSYSNNMYWKKKGMKLTFLKHGFIDSSCV